VLARRWVRQRFNRSEWAYGRQLLASDTRGDGAGGSFTMTNSGRIFGEGAKETP
jgi:hypothetical protein